MMESAKKPTYLILSLVLLVSFIIMTSVSYKESAVMDELAHIPAGYSYVKYFDYRLNPEHPPLVKILSALPLTFMDLNFPRESSAWETDVNGQWTVGTQFLYESHNDADKIIRWARLGPMFLTLTLIVFIYLWTKELLGPWWTLLPTAIFAFSPTVLAHGHYATTDIGAALGIFISIYYFIKYHLQPSRKNLILAGLMFGIAQLLKFSAVILIPYFFFLTIIFYFARIYRNQQQGTVENKFRIFGSGVLKKLGSLFLIFLIGLLLIYPFYFITTFNYPGEKQKTDTEFILASFAGRKPAEGEFCAPVRCLAELNIWAANKPILKAYSQYFLGILMILQRSANNNANYFLGELLAPVSWYYFPLVYLMKEPLPVLFLILLTFVAAFMNIWRAIKEKKPTFVDYLETHPAEFSMILFVIIYSVYSIQSPLNIGIRHLLPIMPFIYILSASGLKRWLKINFLKTRIKSGIIILFFIWFTLETILVYPYYLSYFNQTIGVNDGWRYVANSNYDWGQDLKRLKSFIETNNIDKIGVDYFGGGNSKYYLGDKALDWQSTKGDPRESGIKWLAVSINTIQTAKGKLHPGQVRNPEDEYQWLTDPHKPYTRAGTSIFIYKLQ